MSKWSFMLVNVRGVNPASRLYNFGCPIVNLHVSRLRREFHYYPNQSPRFRWYCYPLIFKCTEWAISDSDAVQRYAEQREFSYIDFVTIRRQQNNSRDLHRDNNWNLGWSVTFLYNGA